MPAHMAFFTADMQNIVRYEELLRKESAAYVTELNIFYKLNELLFN